MALRYWVGGGSSSNWNATGNTNWGTASGVQDNASVPTSADDVIFDGAGVGGNTNSTISATTTILSLNITSGYTATMTHNAVVTITGNVTFGANYTIAGSSGLIVECVPYANTSLTIASNGKTWPNNLTVQRFSLGGTLTTTILGDLTVNGLFSLGGNAVNKTTTERIICNNGLSVIGTTGTIEVVLKGGTWSQIFALGELGISTLTIDGNVTVSGTVTIGTFTTLNYLSGIVTTTGSTLSVSTCTLNTNGIVWNNVVPTYSNVTVTLTSNMSIGGILDVSSKGINFSKTTSETLTIAGGIPNHVGRMAGTAEIILTGGTISTTGGDFISNPLTFNGNVTVSGTLRYTTGTLKYLSGTITTTGSTLAIYGSCTLNTAGITWNNVTVVSFGANITLTSSFVATGSMTISQPTTISKTASETFSIAGITANNTCAGTSEIILTGGTWSGSNTTGISNSLTINGNVTISGNVYYRTGTLKYTSGTVTVTGSTLNITESTTFDTNGMTWNNITLSNTNSLTYTINSLLSASGTLTFGIAANTTFAGTAGFSVATLLNSNTSTVNVNLKDGNTYTVTGALNAFQSRNGSSISIASSSASLRANLVLLAGATCNCLANLTRIDASGGRPIYTFNGTVTDCVNVKSFNDLTTIASSYVNL